MTTLFKSLMILSFSSIVVACGGGESSSEPETPRAPTPSNIPPVVSVNDISVNENTLVTLTADASDPDGDELTYSWNQISGKAINYTNNGSLISFEAPEVSTDSEFRFEVTVFDGQATSKASSTLTVTHINKAPSVAISNMTVDENTLVTLTANASDADGDTLTYSWEQKVGDNVEFKASESSITFEAPDVMIDTEIAFEVTVSDQSLTSSDSSSVLVKDLGKTHKQVYDELRQTAHFSKHNNGWSRFADINLTGNQYSDLIMVKEMHSDDGGEAFVLRYTPEIQSWKFEATDLFGWARSILVEDFNADGKDDVFLADHGSEWGVPDEHQIGAPNNLWFQDEVNQTVIKSDHQSNSNYTHSACAIDINNDGRLDIFEGNIYHQEMPNLLINTANKTFSAEPERLPEMLRHFNSVWCLSGDFDQDGFDDLIVGTPGNSKHWSEVNGGSDLWRSHIILFGDGNKLAYYAERAEILKLDYAPYYYEKNDWYGYMATLDMELIDYNNDQCLDFVSHLTTYDSQYAYEVYAGDCEGRFERVFQVFKEWDTGIWDWTESIIVKDFNGDGREDFVGLHPVPKYFEATADGSYKQKDFIKDYAYQLTPASFININVDELKD